jgi:chromosome segregation ATPase
MDKSTPRGRRSGNPHETPNGPGATPADAASTTATAANGVVNRVRTSAANGVPAGASSAVAALQDAFLDERNDVLSVINELEDQLDRNQEIRENLERELASGAEKLTTAQHKVQELEWQCVTLQTRVDALEQMRQQVATLEEEVADANARTQRVSEQLAAVDKERTQLRNELRNASKQLDELFAVRKERDGLRTDYKSLSVRVEELERTQRELFEERGQLHTELQQTQSNHEQVSNERNQLQLALRSAEDRVRELAQTQEALTERIETLRNEKKAVQAQMTHLERENARLVEQRQFYECEVTSLRNQVRTAEAALQSVKKAFSEVRIALSDTKARARRRAVDIWPRIGAATGGGVRGEIGVLADGQAEADTLVSPSMAAGATDEAVEYEESEPT